jgi:hypothetical protein
MAEQSANTKGLFESLPLSRPAPPQVREPEESLLLPGDRIPEFILPDATTALHNFYDLVRGRPTVLVLAANTARQEQWDELKVYADIAPALESAGADLIVVTNDGVESMAMVAKIIPEAMWLADIKGVVNLSLRSGGKLDRGGLISFVLDSDQRVIALRGPEPGHGTWALSVLRTLVPEAPLELGAVAPILILPRVLDEATCRRLLAQEGLGPTPTAIADPGFTATLQRQLLRRVGPEVDRVFSFDDFQFEALAIQQVGADGERRSERRRDNPDPEKLGRSFALLIDLDAGAYRGGGLRFPEYGPHLYRPATGAALVHAGGIMRELLAIESGQRSFLTLTLRRPLRPSAPPKPIGAA